MKQKIEWYREVLEIEPNSKIFFPLARMLSKDAQPDAAVEVLRQGVGRHPDHIEARLFLVELLYASGRTTELQQEIVVLSDLFKNYPGFWRAWGERLFDESATRDAGLAAIFLAAFLQNIPVSWAGVIEHGLQGLVGGIPVRTSATIAEAYPLADPVPARVPDSSDAERFFTQAGITVGEDADEFSNDAEDDDEGEEPITLRTRSMAEVLAEQGDVAGALDIYQELLLTAASGKEKDELQARIDVLSGNAASVENAEEEGGQTQQEERKDWLSALAQRLEARSLQ